MHKEEELILSFIERGGELKFDELLSLSNSNILLLKNLLLSKKEQMKKEISDFHLNHENDLTAEFSQFEKQISKESDRSHEINNYVSEHNRLERDLFSFESLISQFEEEIRSDHFNHRLYYKRRYEQNRD